MKPTYAIFVAVVLAITIPMGSAQQVTGNGTPAYNSFSGGPDLINDGNLNFHFGVPVFARGGRGLPFSLTLPVDNGAWYTYADIYANWHMGASFSTAQPAGVLAIGSAFYYQKQLQCPNPDDPGNPIQYTQYIFTGYQSPDNTTHSFGYNSVYVYDGAQLDCVVPKYDHPTGTATDGSGIVITAALGNSTITYPSGTALKVPSTDSGSDGVKGNGIYTTTDTNGNTITVDAGANQGQILYILDSLGTQPITVTGGPPPTQVNYRYTAPSGAVAQVAITYTTKTIQSAFACPGIAEQSATSKKLIDKITLPDSTYYQFSYEKTTPTSSNYTGRIVSVHLPTGGTITYNYAGGDTGKGIVCADGSTAGFDRVSTQSGTVKYRRTITSYDPNNPHKVKLSTTSITDNDGNVTKVDFSYGVEIQRRVYQGAATGTPLETVVTCYNGTDPVDPVTCPAPTGTPTVFTRVSVFHSLNGGPYSRVDTFYNSDGSRVTKTDEYDWGANSYSRETQVTYDSTLGKGIVDHPSSVKVYVYDSSGNPYLKSETDYSYDDFTIPGDTVTCAPATKCRGNLTKVIKYVDSSHTLTSQTSYNLTGTVATSQDPNGTTTTYTYGSGACNSAFPTQTQVTFGSTTLTTSATYNCTGAVVLSSTDVNGKSTSTTYTDAYFWRPASTKDQLNNTTTITYPSATVVESTFNFNVNRSTVDVRSTRDTFGRLAYTQKRQGYNSSYYDTVQQMYDTAGRPYKMSMAYQGTAGQAPGSGIYTQTTYDAMMRVTSVQDAAGGIVNTSYMQNDVYREVAPAPAGSTESTKAKQLEYDGLGHLKSVCEITRDTQYGGTCGQTTGGYSGYLTTYAYDMPPYLNSLIVTQNTQPNGGTAQTRTYRYDMLGRLIYESNPESGVNQKFYDSVTGDPDCGTVSSPGDLVKTVDNKGLVSCTTYDGLHRVLSITYPNAPANPATPSKKFVYDSAVVNGTAMSLTAGRMAEAYTCTSCPGTKITDTGFGYTERGELKDVYEATPHSGGYYHVTASYWEHGALKSLGGISGLPTIYYGASDGLGLDGEGRVTKVTSSSGNNLASNATYATSGTSQPIGSLTVVTLGSGDSDAFGYDTLTGRLTSFTFNMNGSVAKNGALMWNANGSLGQVALADNVNIGNTQTCTYSHDDIGRISSANCSGNKWGQNFSYDPFGNVTKSATVGSQFLPTYDLATNRFSSMPGCTPTYDLDGNLLSDCSHIYAWQADGAVAKIDTVELTYDALARVVEQKRGSVYTEIIYSPGGGKLALLNGTTLQKAFIPLPGGGAGVYDSTGLAYYRHSDWLGSSRLATTAMAPTSAYADAEYAPYGEPYGLTGPLDLNFTGLNQDTVPSQNAGLYDFYAREYNPQHARWISPDPAGLGAASPEGPQSWNRYAYVAGSPLNGVDAFGLYRERMELRMYSSSGQTSFGTTYYVDGMRVSANIALGLLGMGAAAECPGNVCGGFSNLGNYVQFVASGGAQGYVRFSDLTQGLYDADGMFFTSDQYNQYILSNYGAAIEAQKQALAQKIADNSGGKISYQQAYESLVSKGGHLQGGNYNFVEATYGPDNLSCGADASRCNGIHFPSPGFVHLDTANPFTGPIGFAEHGFVDVFLGNFAYTLIPRPWP